MNSSASTSCATCGGLIMEPGKTYGYAGPVCHCYVPPRIQVPIQMHFTVGEVTLGKPMKYDVDEPNESSKEIERLKAENERLRNKGRKELELRRTAEYKAEDLGHENQRYRQALEQIKFLEMEDRIERAKLGNQFGAEAHRTIVEAIAEEVLLQSEKKD